jgi:hypothetical protein
MKNREIILVLILTIVVSYIHSTKIKSGAKKSYNTNDQSFLNYYYSVPNYQMNYSNKMSILPTLPMDNSRPFNPSDVPVDFITPKLEGGEVEKIIPGTLNNYSTSNTDFQIIHSLDDLKKGESNLKNTNEIRKIEFSKKNKKPIKKLVEVTKEIKEDNSKIKKMISNFTDKKKEKKMKTEESKFIN